MRRLGLTPSFSVPLSVSRTNSSSFSVPPLVTQLHIRAPPSSVHPQHAYSHSPPHLASLSSGLGATETVTRNLNPDPPPLQGQGAPARDGQLDTFGQGSSPGHMLRAGWPAWRSPLPGKRSPVARPLGRATDPSLQLRRGSDVLLLTFMVTFHPLTTGISVVTVSTLPVRATGGLLLEMKSVLCTESPPRRSWGVRASLAGLHSNASLDLVPVLSSSFRDGVLPSHTCRSVHANVVFTGGCLLMMLVLFSFFYNFLCRLGEGECLCF